MGVPDQYRKLLTEYDRILKVSERMLEELREGGRRVILTFFWRRKAGGQKASPD
jgi:hypothetical protein